MDWVFEYTGYTGYSEIFRSESVDGPALRELSNSMESLALLGLTLGHRAKLVQYFRDRELNDDIVGREVVKPVKRDKADSNLHKTDALDAIAAMKIAVVATVAQERHQSFSNDSSVRQIDPDYISYDDIFRKKQNGKSMLKDKHPAAKSDTTIRPQRLRNCKVKPTGSQVLPARPRYILPLRSNALISSSKYEDEGNSFTTKNLSFATKKKSSSPHRVEESLSRMKNTPFVNTLVSSPKVVFLPWLEMNSLSHHDPLLRINEETKKRL
ncbi:hypothetical protein R1sor_008032 [Riccia sorocarpa]|uniref:SAM domain-containing protein n=1 Tax=Riccia sorocarpa TaxID=122646 RepID=A0ABD3HTW6_9MARC